jgi:L-lactate dehydrogenase complex protein LldE
MRQTPAPMRIGLFATCVADTMFPEAVAATATVLERLGHEVTVPSEQTCCGQMHMNSGYRREALPLAERFLEVFGEFDAVVSPSSSCVGAIRELYGPLLGIEHPLLERTMELSELLVHRLGVEDLGAVYPHRVTYHPTCHSLRMLGVGDRPRRLLESVRGLTLVDLPGAEECCGFGGTFAVKNADTSVAMGADKARHVRDTGAEVLVAGDNSCLMHIGGLLSRQRAGVRVMHLAEILAATESAS